MCWAATTHMFAIMETRVPFWVRLGLIALLGVPQLGVGVWALLAGEHWFESFPGVGPDLIAADPPFNAHLASDVGAAFFATGLGLLLAAYWGTRRVVQLALAVTAAFTAPHVLYHVANPAPGLSGVADVANAGLLASSLLWVALLWWGSTAQSRSADDEAEPTSAAVG